MEDKPLRIMMIGAHPDDCDICCGGIAIKFARLGHVVKFVSVTDGSAGHQSHDRATLAAIRRGEAQAAAKVAGIEYEVLTYPDGELEVTLESRSKVLRVIRAFDPDIIFAPRPNDYHPDHRNTAQLVQDASYLVMVPNVCPDVPYMKHQPAIFYMCDDFARPYPFSADIVVNTADIFEQKLQMVSSHHSQFDEWLPWIARLQRSIPADYDDSRYPRDSLEHSDSDVATRFRKKLIARYGQEKGSQIAFAEAFELSEYGSSMTTDEMQAVFPL